jgi:hypothetical protein
MIGPGLMVLTPYAARRQLLGDRAAERTRRRLGRAVDCAASQAAVRAGHRSGQDDRAAVRNDRDGVLDQEKCAFDVHVELIVEERLVEAWVAKRSIPVELSHGNRTKKERCRQSSKVDRAASQVMRR